MMELKHEMKVEAWYRVKEKFECNEWITIIG